jgi:hypothetical protein
MIKFKMEPTSIYTEIISRVKRLVAGNRFYNWREARELDDAVCDIVRSIREDLAPVSLPDAVSALQFLVERDGKIIESVDTSDGTVYPHLQDAVALLGEFWAQTPGRNQNKIARYVFERLCDNGYGVFDYMIEKCKVALGDEGLVTLEKLFRDEVAQQSENFKKQSLVSCLKEIADAQNNVDKYLELTREFPSVSDQYDNLQSAKRLVGAGRAQEALTLMAGVDRNVAAWKSDIDDVLLRCYQKLGLKDEAKQLLEQGFLSSPSCDTLQRLLDVTEDSEENRERYIECAVSKTTSPFTLMRFLVEIKDDDRLASLVRKKNDSWDGGMYFYLTPAAELLEQRYPLEASILYRALIDDVMERAQSRYYHHAARYLKQLTILEPHIADYGSYQSQQDYVAAIRHQHKRKSAFWKLVSVE